MANNKDNNIKWHAALTTFVNNVKAKFTKIEGEYKAADTKIVNDQKVINDGKANVALDNVKLSAADAGKHLAIKADGGVEPFDQKKIDDAQDEEIAKKMATTDADTKYALKTDIPTVPSFIETDLKLFRTDNTGSINVSNGDFIAKRIISVGINRVKAGLTNNCMVAYNSETSVTIIDTQNAGLNIPISLNGNSVTISNNGNLMQYIGVAFYVEYEKTVGGKQ